jgi:chain length determinant protein EpsF
MMLSSLTSGCFDMSLQQLLIIFWARKGLVVAYLLVVMTTTLVLSLITPKQYAASTSLVLDQPGINPITGAQLPTQLTAGYMATQTDIIKSPMVALVAVDILKLADDKGLQADFKKDKMGGGDFSHWMADDLMKKLEVLPSRESSILSIGFSATDPEFAAKAANAFAQAYIRVSNELKRQPAQQTADWFEEQLKQLRERVEKAREKLSDFQQDYGIIATPSEKIDLEDAKLTELSNQLVRNQLETADLVSKKNLLTATLINPESIKSLPEMLNNPTLQAFKSSLSSAEAKFADVSIRFDHNHPQYRQAAAEIANLKSQIKAEMNTILHGFNSRILASKNRDDSLAKALAQQKTKVLQFKKQHNEIETLKREAENAQIAYDAVNQRSIQLRMESEIRQSNIAVLDEAVVPKVADKPKIKLNMIISVLLGTILGVSAALFAEIMDRRIRSAADITETLDLPVFGIITNPRPAKKFPWSYGVRS